MEIRTEQHNETTVVTIVGSIDALTAGQVAGVLGGHVESGHGQLVLDLGQVDFMSSAGLRAILDILRRNRQHGGDLRLAAAQAGVQRTLEMSGFTRILKSYATVDEAVASYHS